MIEVLYTAPVSLPGSGPALAFTREDHRIKELSLVRAGKRVPRRSQTHEDYKLPESSLAAIHSILHQLRVTEETPKQLSNSTTARPQQEAPAKPAPRRRPPLGPPRRSYSATDKEPVSAPSAAFKLLDLPGELHFAIFDFLDPIDSTCLGLVNKHFYSIHRRMRGTVPLNTRRDGPNELEWAWHLAGNIVRAPPATRLNGIDGEAATEQGGKEKNSLSLLRVRGQAYCRKCGVTRCELHKHIQSWVGEDAEYCSITRKFGQAARPDAKSYCYRSKPGDEKRCGRHWVRKSKVVLQ
ncbi:hypothetical protein B0T16DRAFT_333654 [Cercophora newfieldiana]|uniref:F-box domain-containing protein n=1 Tax=Cercophora newfieldiana TaxID=92897 RepID=A0AA39Y3P1_9PEZI|nr:hypothetical protein B0T16DRAFT_333654 [Cercophora newfieldiana]